MSGGAESGLRPYRPGEDDAAVLAMRSEVWGADHPHAAPEFFRWLFGAGNPAGPGSGVMLARGGKLVGFAGLCPRLARVQGSVVRVAHGLDYMVSPTLSAAASGRFALRVASEWATLARGSGYAFGVNYPNAASRRLLTSDLLGWQPVLEPALMVRPLVAPAAAFSAGGALRRGALRAGLALGAGVARLRAGLSTGRAAGEARALDLSQAADLALIDALWAQAADARPCGLIRDAAALRWRYGQHPLQSYRVLGWEAGGQLLALVVTSRRHLFGMDCLLIVDALAAAGQMAALGRLLGRAVAETGPSPQGGAALAVAQAAPGDDLHRGLRQAGFQAVPLRFNPKPFVMVALPLAGEGPAPFGTGTDWRFGWGDMDVV